MSDVQEKDSSESSSVSTSSISSRISYGIEISDMAVELLEPFGTICTEMEQQLSALNELGPAVPAESADSRAVTTAAPNEPRRSESLRSILKVSEAPKDLTPTASKEGKLASKKKKSDREAEKKRWRSVLGPALGSFGLLALVLAGLAAIFAFAIIFRGGRVAPQAHIAKATTRNDTVSPSG